MNQNAILGIVRSSAIVGAVSRMLETAERAAQGSATRVVWSSMADAWRRFDRSLRLRSLGVALVTAVIVHLGLIAFRPVPGWRAFVVPAIALAQGLLLILVSSTRSNH